MIRWMSRRNVGILITDHNVRETLKICNRAHILSHGEVIVSGAADQILSNPVAKNSILERISESSIVVSSDLNLHFP